MGRGQNNILNVKDVTTLWRLGGVDEVLAAGLSTTAVRFVKQDVVEAVYHLTRPLAVYWDHPVDRNNFL